MKQKKSCDNNPVIGRNTARRVILGKVRNILIVVLVITLAVKLIEIIPENNTGNNEDKSENERTMKDEPRKLSRHETLVDSYSHAFQEKYDVMIFIDSSGNILRKVKLDDFISPPLRNVIPVWDGEEINQEWINAWRAKITPDKAAEGFYPYVRSTSRFLREGIKNGVIDSNETFTDVVWRRSQENLSGEKITKLDFLKEVLKDLPSKELRYLALYGEVGIESAFDNEAESGVGAKGAFQFMKETGKKYGLNIKEKSDERTDFVMASGAFSEYLADIYNNIDELPSMKKIEQEFNFSDDWLKSYATINGYHSGEKRIEWMLDWFATNYTKEDVISELGESFSSKMLYTFITEKRKESRLDRQFGIASANYHLQLTALARLMESRDTNKDTPAYWYYALQDSDQSESVLCYREDNNNTPSLPDWLLRAENQALD